MKSLVLALFALPLFSFASSTPEEAIVTSPKLKSLIETYEKSDNVQCNLNEINLYDNFQTICGAESCSFSLEVTCYGAAHFELHIDIRGNLNLKTNEAEIKDVHTWSRR